MATFRSSAYTRRVKEYYVYILSNFTNTVLYVGVTNDLVRRVWEHREKIVPGFTAKYDVWKLVYFESSTSVTSAIEREKQIKSWSRARKDQLIDATNKPRRDLYPDIAG